MSVMIGCSSHLDNEMVQYITEDDDLFFQIAQAMKALAPYALNFVSTEPREVSEADSAPPIPRIDAASIDELPSLR